MGFFRKTRKVDGSDIAKMIRVITSSPVNTTSDVLRDVDLGDIYTNVYQDYNFRIKCVTKFRNEFKYEMYYNNELVFWNVASQYSSFTEDGYGALYEVRDVDLWYDNFLEIYSECSNAYNRQKAIREAEARDNEAYYSYVSDITKRQARIEKVFYAIMQLEINKVSGGRGYFKEGEINASYEDDIIIIDNITYKNDIAPDYSNSKDTTTYYGVIRFKDGTVLMDSYNDIFHPGDWEDYVIHLTNDFLDELRYSSNSKKALKKSNKKRQYMLNHSPIDDSKYFR